MQPVALLFAVFVLSFVAGIGWYAGRGVAQILSRSLPRGETKLAPRVVEQSAEDENKTLSTLE
jgi:hypothetical protein